MAKYRWEMVSCGRCRRCISGGRSHGPYLYRYEGSKRSRKHLYGGHGKAPQAVGERVPPDAPVEPYGEPILPNPKDQTPDDTIPPMDPGTASRMREDAIKKADCDERRARKKMTRGERKDYDRMLERLNEDSGAYKRNCERERRIIADSGIPMPSLTGRALAAIKEQIIQQLEEEKKGIIEMLRAERKALAKQMAESRKELRKMLKPAPG